ncbi:uncharacterized protein LOC143575998 [Bidens hawaiensis]|uniref:uncharacterized protein LOC143575998 n=1 Tax=Bidens hawaiensis TaxID=980011 RepID=UPI00404A2C44
MVGRKEDATPMSFMSGRKNNDADWVVDFGSTKHITHNSDILKNIFQNRFEAPVVIPNGDVIPVKGRGECTLIGGAKIKNVLHIPKLTCNLLSVSRLTNDLQSAITFFPDFCVMQKLNTRNLIGTGECRRGLYRMRLIDNKRKAMMTSGDTWHKRLGHASVDKLTHIDFPEQRPNKTTKTPIVDEEITEIQDPSENINVGETPSNKSPSVEVASPLTQHMNENEIETSHRFLPNQDNHDVFPQVEVAEHVRAKRNKSQPKYLDDFIVKLTPPVDHACTSPNSSTVHPLTNFVSYTKFSKSHKAFLAAIDSNDEPKHFHQAIKDVKWKEAMKKEIRALEENGTWTLQELPEGKHVIDSKWVYKVKYKPNGEVERYKARLVAKGFQKWKVLITMTLLPLWQS